jgi:hypothetical protein
MFSWAAIVYILALVTSCVCAWLLVRSYMRHRTRLLLWSAACFLCLALNNLVVVIDLLVIPDIDLTIVRTLASLAGVSTLLCGFIWEVD